MSLVLEALRRVEKPDTQSGIVGVAVPSYRPTPSRRRSLSPLLFGLAAGGLLVLAFGPASRPAGSPEAARESRPLRSEATTRTAKGAAGLPPPLIIESETPHPMAARQVADSDLARSRQSGGAAAAEPRRENSRPTTPARAPAPAFVLQAISERDSQPIAIINDQLVKEGDRLAGARVVRIGTETVEIVLASGEKDLVRFAPPPPPEPSPTSLPEGR